MTFKTSGGVKTKEVEYTYDYLGRRIRKAIDTDGNGTVDDYFYNVHRGNELALEFRDQDGLTGQTYSSTVNHRYLYGAAVDQILAVENAAGQVLFGLADHEGTIRDVVNSAAQLVNHVKFDSFGDHTDTTAPGVDFLFGFTGRPYDPDTDLYDYRARWYDPEVGRWLTEDPAGFDAGDMNLYRYAGNSPVMNVDPSGMAFGGFWNTYNSIAYGVGQALVGATNTVSSWLMGGSTTTAPTTGPLATPSLDRLSQGGVYFGGSNPVSPVGKPSGQSGGSWYGTPPTALPAVTGSPIGASSSAASTGYQSPIGSFFGSLWSQAADFFSTYAEGTYYLVSESAARSSFATAWNETRVEPLGQRWYGKASARGYSDAQIGDWWGIRPLGQSVLFDFVPVDPTAEYLERYDLGEGRPLQGVELQQRGLTALSGWAGTAAMGTMAVAKVPALGEQMYPATTATATVSGPAHKPVLGSEWYEYFQAKYGAENVQWSRLPTFTGPKSQGGTGTIGVLRTPHGEFDVISGRSGPAASMSGNGFDIVSRMHAEGHASAIMRILGDTEGTLYINNPEICSSCTKNLDRMLPSDGRLDVVLPNGNRIPFPRGTQ